MQLTAKSINSLFLLCLLFARGIHAMDCKDADSELEKSEVICTR